MCLLLKSPDACKLFESLITPFICSKALSYRCPCTFNPGKALTHIDARAKYSGYSICTGGKCNWCLQVSTLQIQSGSKWFKVNPAWSPCKVVESKPIDLAVVARLFRAVQKWLYPGHYFVREVEAMRDVSPWNVQGQTGSSSNSKFALSPLPTYSPTDQPPFAHRVHLESMISK